MLLNGTKVKLIENYRHLIKNTKGIILSQRTDGVPLVLFENGTEAYVSERRLRKLDIQYEFDF